MSTHNMSEKWEEYLSWCSYIELWKYWYELQVFLRENEKCMLDEALHCAIMKRVICVQRYVKTKVERKNFLMIRESTMLLQVKNFCNIFKCVPLSWQNFQRACPAIIWASAWQNQQNGMCAQRRFRSGWGIRPVWSESLLSAWRRLGP